MKKTMSTNPLMQELIKESTMKAYDEDAPIWRDVAKRLLRSKSRAEINISRIARHTNKNDTVLVPGKLLGSGSINHPVTVGAVGFSEAAKEKLTKAGGKHMGIKELMTKVPKGTNVKIME
jgi:large subunit ribosomal protein L18e